MAILHPGRNTQVAVYAMVGNPEAARGKNGKEVGRTEERRWV
jgi:hypothetical protein